MQLHAFTTLVRKEVRRFLRIWTQTLLPAVVTSTLYFLIFGELIGKRIGDFEGYAYASFIAPGLIMMTIINNTYGNVVGSFYSARFNHSVEELLISPMPNALILSAYVCAGVLRGIIVGVLVTCVALFFTDIHIVHPFVTVAVLLLTAIAFSIGGFVNAIYARGFDDAAIVPTFVLTPLTYLGGVFYSISVLPPFWQSVSQINPILYMVTGFRYGFLGISDVPLWQTFGFLILLCVGLTFWALKLMNTPGRLRQ